MVDIVEQNSGPGVALYACAPCREQRGLTPVAEQAHEVAYRDYLIHTTDCAGCSRLGRCDVGGRLRDIYQKALGATPLTTPSKVAPGLLLAAYDPPYTNLGGDP